MGGTAGTLGYLTRYSSPVPHAHRFGAKKATEEKPKICRSSNARASRRLPSPCLSVYLPHCHCRTAPNAVQPNGAVITWASPLAAPSLCVSPSPVTRRVAQIEAQTIRPTVRTLGSPVFHWRFRDDELSLGDKKSFFGDKSLSLSGLTTPAARSRPLSQGKDTDRG